MIGDDACSTFVELLKKLLDIIGNIERERRKGAGAREVHIPKIKVGSLSKSAFNKLNKSGVDFKYVTVPADKQAEIEEAVKKMGGSYFDAHFGDSNNRVMAVPANQLDLLNTALKHVVAQELADNADKLKIKDGSDLVSEEDMGIVTDVMNRYDIPVISFKTEDNMYMNVVPAEYEGEYKAAMEEVEKIKAEIENIDVVRFNQTAPLDNLDYYAEVVPKDEAADLSILATAENLDIKFAEQEDSVAVLYKANISERVEKARREYTESLEQSESFLIDIANNVITLDVGALMIDELCDNDSYFMKVPGTMGQDYIRIDKEDAAFINGGKTVQTTLDYDKKYPVFDKEGKVKREVSGEALAGHFNSRNIHANKETKQYNFNTDGKELGRIDLYNAEKNELISIKLENAEKVRSALAERGLTHKAIKKVLDDINAKLSEKEKAVFNYTAEKTEIVYADIPNIGELIAQTELSRAVVGKAECMGEISRRKGETCFFHDKNTDSFATIPLAPHYIIRAELIDRGYSERIADILTQRVMKDCHKYDDWFFDEEKEEKPEKPQIEKYGFENAELNKMGFCNLDNSTIIIKEDSENYGYMQIEKGISLYRAEKAFREEFGIVDDISVALAVKQLVTDGVINDYPKHEHGEATVTKLTGEMVDITCKETGQSIIMPIRNIDTDELINLGITEKTANDIKRSFEKQIEKAENPEKQTLGDLIKHGATEIAKKAGDGAKEVGKNISSTIKEKMTKGQGR